MRVSSQLDGLWKDSVSGCGLGNRILPLPLNKIVGWSEFPLSFSAADRSYVKQKAIRFSSLGVDLFSMVDLAFVPAWCMKLNVTYVDRAIWDESHQEQTPFLFYE